MACVGLLLVLSGVAMVAINSRGALTACTLNIESSPPPPNGPTNNDALILTDDILHGRQAVLLTFTGHPHAYNDPTMLPRLATALERTLKDATPIARRVKVAIMRESIPRNLPATVQVHLAVQVGVRFST